MHRIVLILLAMRAAPALSAIAPVRMMMRSTALARLSPQSSGFAPKFRRALAKSLHTVTVAPPRLRLHTIVHALEDEDDEDDEETVEYGELMALHVPTLFPQTTELLPAPPPLPLPLPEQKLPVCSRMHKHCKGA